MYSTNILLNLISTIFKTINSSVDDTRKTLALFNKDWNTYKTNWQNANGFWGKVGSVFAPSKSTSVAPQQLQILKNWNNAVKHGCTNQETFNRIIADADDKTKLYFAGLKKGKGSVEGLKNAQNVAKDSTIGLTIAQTALNAAISMGIGILINLAITGITKLVNANKEAIESANELREKYADFKETNASNISTLKGLEDEFTELSKGVSQYGDNISLTTEQYDRYREIVQQIVGMSPSLAEGYDTENGYIADKNGLLERAIELQEIEYRNELRKITNLQNLKTSMAGYIAEYKEAFEGGFVTEDMSAISTEKATDFSNALYQAFNFSERYDGGYKSEDLAREILTSLGVDNIDKEMEKFFNENGYYQSSWFFSKYADEIANNIDAVANALSFEGVGLDEDEFENRILTLKDCAQAYLDMKDSISMANESIQTDLRYIAEYADGYDSLSSEQQKFVNEFLKGFNIDDITSRDWFGNLAYDEDKMKSVKRQINDFVEALSQDETTKDALSKLYAIPTDSQSVGDFVSQFRSALDTVRDYCEENGIEIPLGISESETEINELEAQYNRVVEYAKGKFDGYDFSDFFKTKSINSKEELDKFLEIAQGANTATEAMEKYVQSSTSLDKMTDSLSELEGASDKIKTLGSAFKELSDDGYITTKTLGEIRTATGLSGDEWAEYETKLLNAKKGSAEFNQVLSELTYKILENEFATIDLTNATDEEITAIENKIAAILRENGVTNASAVAHEYMRMARVNEAIAAYDGTQASYDSAAALISESLSAEQTKVAMARLELAKLNVNKAKITSADDIDNIIAIANAALVGAEALVEFQKAKVWAENVSAETLSQVADGTFVGPLPFGKAGVDLLQGKYTFEIDKLDPSDFKVGAPRYSGGTNPKDSDSGSNKNDALDNFLKAAEQRYEIHEDEIAYIDELNYALKELCKTDEERYELNKKIEEAYSKHSKDRIADIEHYNELLENQGLQYSDGYISNAREAQKIIADEDSRYRKKKRKELLGLWGLDEETLAGLPEEAKTNVEKTLTDMIDSSDYIQELQKDWWSWEEKIQDALSSSFDEEEAKIEHKIKLTLEADPYADITSFYDQLQEAYHAEAERLRAINPIKYADEIRELSEKWWDAEQSKADWRWENSQRWIDQRNAYNDWGLFDDSEIQAWERVVKWLREEYPNDLERIQEAEQSLFEARKEEFNKATDLASSYLDSRKTLLQSYYDVTNSVAEAQHEIDKELAASLTMSEYLDRRTHNLLFNQEDYNVLSEELYDIQYKADKLQREYQRALSGATLDTIEEITSNYEMQYETLMKSYEIAKAELEVAKKRQQLDNVLNERNVRMFINGQWQWVANTQDVINAQNEYADAKYEAERARIEKTQTDSLNNLTAQQDHLGTIINQFESGVINLDYAIDQVVRMFGDLPTAVYKSLTSARIHDVSKLETGQIYRGDWTSYSDGKVKYASNGMPIGQIYNGSWLDYEAHADGTRYTKHGNVLMGEVEPEMFITNNGHLIPINQPTFGNVSAGGIVFNHDQMEFTRSLWDMTNMSIPNYSSLVNHTPQPIAHTEDNRIIINGMIVDSGSSDGQALISSLRRYVGNH